MLFNEYKWHLNIFNLNCWVNLLNQLFMFLRLWASWAKVGVVLRNLSVHQCAHCGERRACRRNRAAGRSRCRTRRPSCSSRWPTAPPPSSGSRWTGSSGRGSCSSPSARAPSRSSAACPAGRRRWLRAAVGRRANSPAGTSPSTSPSSGGSACQSKKFYNKEHPKFFQN